MKPAESGSAPRQIGAGGNGDLAVRLRSALILVPVALAGAWWGGWPAYALAALVAAIVLAEWAVIVGRSPSLVPTGADVRLGTAFVVAAALLAGISGPAIGLAVVIVGAAAVFALSRSLWLAAGSVYAGLLGLSLAGIRSDPSLGLAAILVLLVVVWANDSVAFFAGRTFGGPKLWPRVSPKKTWSGSIGGLVGGVVLGAAAARVANVPLAPGLFVMLVCLSVASQAGDLLESAIKRRFDRKDASAIIPGHGGMMDRVDGLIFAGAFAFFVGWVHGGAGSIGRGVLLW